LNLPAKTQFDMKDYIHLATGTLLRASQFNPPGQIPPGVTDVQEIAAGKFTGKISIFPKKIVGLTGYGATVTISEKQFVLYGCRSDYPMDLLPEDEFMKAFAAKQNTPHTEMQNTPTSSCWPVIRRGLLAMNYWLLLHAGLQKVMNGTATVPLCLPYALADLCKGLRPRIYATAAESVLVEIRTTTGLLLHIEYYPDPNPAEAMIVVCAMRSGTLAQVFGFAPERAIQALRERFGELFN
jgi:hypothetical protein